MLDLPDLSHRDRRPERMDQPDIEATEHRRALRGLASLQRARGTRRLLWREVEACLRERPGRELRVLDVACGGGDVAVGIARTARRRGLPVEVAGCDRSQVALAAARQTARRQGVEVELEERDVLEDGLPEGFDLIVSGLFLHHLEESEAVGLLREMRRVAGRALWIDDLRRSRLGYLYAWIGSRVLTRSPTVRVDSLLSVRAAFTRREAVALAGRAGLAGARVVPRWPESWILSWRRS